MLDAINNSNIKTNFKICTTPIVVYPAKNRQNVSFDADFLKVIKHLKPKNTAMSLRSKIFFMFSKCGGELETILFNGVGKAFLAPLVIAFNPLSKEKKEDKAYMAWKQPISAVVNLGAQLLILLNVNKYLDKLAKKGILGDLYSSVAVDSKILEQNAKRLNVLKGRTSFALAIISMPVVCGIVNWLYPRVMNTIFPKLSKCDKPNNYVEKGNKRDEC